MAARAPLHRFWASLQARYAVVLVAVGVAAIPLAHLSSPGGGSTEQLYASALATGCGLAALLLFEEQLLGRSNPRLLGLCGTFLLLMTIAISWATAYARGLAGGATYFPARLEWHLALGLGIAVSLATPDRVWDWISRRLAANAVTYTLVAGGTALLLAAVAIPAASLLARALVPSAGSGTLAGTGLAAGWLTLGLESCLLAISATRWGRLGATERWVLAACAVAATGLLLALVGGGSEALGSQLGWGETALGLLLVIGVLSSHMYSGEHQKLLLEIAERQVLREVASILHPEESPDQTAERICRELVRLRGAINAHVVSFPGVDGAISVASYPPPSPDYPAPPLRPLSRARAVPLRQRAAVGPWIERCGAAAAQAQDPALREYWLTYVRLGIQAFAYAPIRRGDQVLGLLVAGAGDPDPDIAASHLTQLLPSLVDFALAATNVLAPLLDSAGSGPGEAEQVLKSLTEDSFYPVFQPIMDLGGGDPIGYEALTRFPDGLTPDRAFPAAERSGLQTRLELAAFRKALQQGGGLLRGGQFLSLNLSPEVLVANCQSLGRILGGWPHQAVIEITEHSEVADYDRLRAATACLGDGTRLAVDDAGAGYSSLRHILELRPDFVKLDLSLVQGMVGDPAREALVAGIQHFAERSGWRLIAEGVETKEELDRLRELGVNLGQGYLLGRPMPQPIPLEAALLT